MLYKENIVIDTYKFFEKIYLYNKKYAIDLFFNFLNTQTKKIKDYNEIKEILNYQWNKIFIDARLTAALVDRLIHHAHILSFTGESFRLKNALSKSK